MNKYPLIQAAGLRILDLNNQPAKVILADDLERVLEQAPVVFRSDGVLPLRYQGALRSYECWTDAPEAANKTTARLICVQPIAKPDTAESLLREFLACGQGSTNWGDVMNRTRRLLEASNGK